MPLSLDDAQAFLASAVHFSQEKIAKAQSAPERPLSITQAQALSLEAQQLGFLPQAEKGFALWEHSDSQGAMTFNIGLLQALAEVNSSLALAWHRQALAMATLKACEFSPASANPLSLTLLSTGRFGLGRLSLGRYWRLPKEQKLEAEHELCLQDYFDRQQEAVLLAPDSWQELLWPIWQQGEVRLQCLARTELRVRQERRQHGMDDLCAFHIQYSASASASRVLSHPQYHPKDCYRLLVLQDWLGLLAIGTGALARVERQTQAYTVLRKQGGHCIAQHPAVMQMLTQISGARLAAQHELERFSRPLAAISLVDVLHARLRIQPLLCAAASDAMQAHGGVGYMRDLGVEKVFREQNTLRVQSGGLLDIPLLLQSLAY